MTQPLSPDTITEKNKTESEDIPIFVDVFLDSETLHFVNSDEDVLFFDIAGVSTNYWARKMKRETKRDSIDMQLAVMNAEIDNVDQALSAYAVQDFRDRRIVVRACFRNLISAAVNAWRVFDGFIDKPVITETGFQVNLKPRIGQGSINMLLGVKQQLPCNLTFSGSRCAYGRVVADLKDLKTAQVVDSGATGYIVDAVRVEADDYWNYGYLTFAVDTMTVALRGVTRMIKDFVLSDHKVYFSVSLPATPQAGDTYSIERGCDLTLDSCQNKFNNDANYQGIHTLPALMVRR